MKLFLYTILNDIFSASNCRDINKQKERAPVVRKFPKSPL